MLAFSDYVHEKPNYAHEHHIQNLSMTTGIIWIVQKYEAYCFMLKTDKVKKYLLLGKL